MKKTQKNDDLPFTWNELDLLKAEDKIQQECVMWYKNRYCLKHNMPRCMIFSIPNEGRGAASQKLIATGLYPGAADLMLIHQSMVYFEDGSPFVPSDPKICFIECKAKTGIQSSKQKLFEEHCSKMGLRYFIVRSLEQFKAVVTSL